MTLKGVERLERRRLPYIRGDEDVGVVIVRGPAVKPAEVRGCEWKRIPPAGAKGSRIGIVWQIIIALRPGVVRQNCHSVGERLGECKLSGVIPGICRLADLVDVGEGLVGAPRVGAERAARRIYRRILVDGDGHMLAA